MKKVANLATLSTAPPAGLEPATVRCSNELS